MINNRVNCFTVQGRRGDNGTRREKLVGMTRVGLRSGWRVGQNRLDSGGAGAGPGMRERSISAKCAHLQIATIKGGQ